MTETSVLPRPTADSYDWQRRAACRDMDSGVFFHPDNDRGHSRRYRELHAKRVCQTCPVRQACLAHALRVREPYGVWGGYSEGERVALLKHREPETEPA